MMTAKISALAVCAVFLTICTGCVFLASARDSESRPENSLADETGELTSGTEIAPLVDASNPNKAEGISMRVLWTVSGYVFGKASAMDEQEAKALLFKPLDIKETEIIFSGGICKGVTFQKEIVDTAQYLATIWQITPETLGIDEQKIQVITTNCDIPGFHQYMRLSDRRLIVPINGVFFFFEPAVTQ